MAKLGAWNAHSKVKPAKSKSQLKAENYHVKMWYIDKQPLDHGSAARDPLEQIQLTNGCVVEKVAIELESR